MQSFLRSREAARGKLVSADDVGNPRGLAAGPDAPRQSDAACEGGARLSGFEFGDVTVGRCQVSTQRRRSVSESTFHSAP